MEYISNKTLYAVVSASPYDADYDMAYLYCSDKQSDYCFSLSRFPHEDSIEIMVLDQINTHVADLTVRLTGSCLDVRIPVDVAARLDNIEKYVIHLDISQDERLTIVETLEKIFEGKSGFSIV